MDNYKGMMDAIRKLNEFSGKKRLSLTKAAHRFATGFIGDVFVVHKENKFCVDVIDDEVSVEVDSSLKNWHVREDTVVSKYKIQFVFNDGSVLVAYAPIWED